MAAPRFYVDIELASGAHVALPAGVAHHAARVLRLRDGDPIVLFNGRGGEYIANFVAHPPSADVTAFDPVERESALPLALLQSLIAGEKLDWVIEKAVELGAAHVVIVPAARSVARPEGERLVRRLAHWRDVAIAACCQCGRNRLPAIHTPPDFEAALAAMAGMAQRYVLTPLGGQPLARARAVATCVAVGPEGGFTDDELAMAVRHGFVPARWGPRVLRTETAGLAALAALQTLRGDCAVRDG